MMTLFSGEWLAVWRARKRHLFLLLTANNIASKPALNQIPAVNTEVETGTCLISVLLRAPW